MNINIGEALKELRLARQLSQDNVAKILKVSRQAYTRYENNQREIPIESLCILADYYDESLDYICGRTAY
jgi:transcriptional regulator with XRE-family HTH domain